MQLDSSRVNVRGAAGAPRTNRRSVLERPASPRPSGLRHEIGRDLGRELGPATHFDHRHRLARDETAAGIAEGAGDAGEGLRFDERLAHGLGVGGFGPRDRIGDGVYSVPYYRWLCAIVLHGAGSCRGLPGLWCWAVPSRDDASRPQYVGRGLRRLGPDCRSPRTSTLSFWLRRQWRAWSMHFPSTSALSRSCRARAAGCSGSQSDCRSCRQSGCAFNADGAPPYPRRSVGASAAL